tara:strand:+ start:2232 stop:2954 length:723 start_codon:yes stop_codon:yes gene_type:complete
MAHYVIILAAGNSIRLKKQKEPKQFLELNKQPVIGHSMCAFEKYDTNIKMYVGLGEKQINNWESLCIKKKINTRHNVFVGGNERINTVYRGLNIIEKNNNIKESDLISIHDAARPLINAKFISKLVEHAKKYGNAIPYTNIKNSLKRFKRNVNRSDYKMTQTPQCFHFQLIYEAYRTLFNSPEMLRKKHKYNDDSSVYELIHGSKTLNFIDGPEYNIKVTTDLDYYLLTRLFEFSKENAE